jgi:hypothetical protein
VYLLLGRIKTSEHIFTPLILISEELKKTLEESKLQGFDFKEYKQLIS